MTLTPFLRLNKPAFDDVPWDEAINGNADILDAFVSLFMSIPNFAGTWQNAHDYVVGQNALDVTINQVFTCLVSHQSGASPTTFLEDRTNDDTLWEQTIPAAPVTIETNYDIGRNLVINSTFTVAQRGDSFTEGGFTLDQWALIDGGDTFSITQEEMDDSGRQAIHDESAQYFLRNVFTGDSDSGSMCALTQYMENSRRFAGKVVTVSFWAKANATKNLGVGFYQDTGSGGSGDVEGVGQKVVLTTSWVRYSLTFTLASLINATFGADSWTALSFYYTAEASNNTVTGSVGVQSGTIDLWGVQVEFGTTASALEKKSPAIILQECQRHFQVYYSVVLDGYATMSGTIRETLYYNTTMRTSPAITIDETFSSNASGMETDIISSTHTTFKASVTALGNGLIIGNVSLSAELSD